MSKEYSPLKLIKNIVFPSYQLSAVAEATKISVEEILKICVLETLFWIRQKFENLEIPEELKSPSPSQYENYSLSDLKTFRIEKGYIVDVIYLKNMKSWSFQLVEPDLAASVRTPVPGRVFTTDISFKIMDNIVMCAFRTLVSQPENCQEDVISLRNGVIKRLVRNPLIKLSHIDIPIVEKMIVLNSDDKIKQFNQNVQSISRELPLIVFAEYKPEKIKQNDTQIHDITLKNSLSVTDKYSLNNLSSSKISDFNVVLDLDSKKKSNLPLEKISSKSNKKQNTDKINMAVPVSKKNETYYLYDINDIAKDLMGYAIVYSVHFSKLSEFRRITEINLSSGDAVLIEPKQYGQHIIYKCSENAEKKLDEIKKYMSVYHVKKAVDLSNFSFVNDARIIQQEEMLNNCHTLGEMISARSELVKELETMKSANKELNEYKAKSVQLEDRLTKANSIIEDLKQKLQHSEELLKEEKKQKSDRENLLEIQLDYYKSLEKRPKFPRDIPAWIKKNFSDTMVLHERAVDLLENIDAQEVNMKKLCDALEYLAVEYSMLYLKKCDKETSDKLASLKYNQSFNVSPSGGSGDVKKLSRHYKIKYDRNDGNGRKEYPLDMHLKSGKHNDNLIRIYFNYDEVNSRIVIGSLPKHLPTSTQTT